MGFESQFTIDEVVPLLHSPHDPDFLTHPDNLHDADVRRTADEAWRSLGRYVLAGDSLEMGADQELYRQTLHETGMALRSLARLFDSRVRDPEVAGYGFQIVQDNHPRSNIECATSLFVNEDDEVVLALESRRPTSLLEVAIREDRQPQTRLLAAFGAADTRPVRWVSCLEVDSETRINPAIQREMTFSGLKLATLGLFRAHAAQSWPSIPGEAMLQRYAQNHPNLVHQLGIGVL